MLSTLFLLSILYPAFAVPQLSPTPAGQSITLTRKPRVARSVDDWGAWAKTHREMLEAKYGDRTPIQRRSSGTNLLTNQGSDSSFYGSLAIGTPAIAFDVILDTGSADLWVADSTCTSCGGVPSFTPASSSSFQNVSQEFKIQYGSGAAVGTLGTDTVQMAGFSVANQVFAVCNDVTSGLLSSPVSGLLGLAWESLAASGATPFWQTLASSGSWDSPVMAFFLTRYQNVSDAQTLEPGGSFTMGFTNSSLFTGDIEYINVPSGAVIYWTLPMTDLTAQGSSISLPSAYAAIDTGTTLVGGPSAQIAALYALIPGSAPGTGTYQGYYTYPCSTTVNVTLSFGGSHWPVSNGDFQLTQLTKTECLGAFFALSTGSNSPSWIVGDTFLKNVYSVFRYSPASVGFATLSSTALAMNGAGGAIPSATIGAVTATVTAGTRHSSDAVTSSSSWGGLCGVGVMAVLAMLGTLLV